MSKEYKKKPNEKLIAPDKFVLDKDELLRLFEKVSKFWKRDDFSFIQNTEYEAIMQTTKLAIKGTDFTVLENIWFGLNFFIDEVRTLNTLKLAYMESSPKMKDQQNKLYAMEWHRIDSGEAFIEN